MKDMVVLVELAADSTATNEQIAEFVREAVSIAIRAHEAAGGDTFAFNSGVVTAVAEYCG